jgi:hypothetical protein
LQPSNAINVQYQQYIKAYKDSLSQKMGMDRVTCNKYVRAQQTIELLKRTQPELNALIPKSSSGPDMSQNPCIQAIKVACESTRACEQDTRNLLDKAQGLHNEQGVFEEMLLKVHKNLLDKQTVIDMFNNIYDKHFE